VFGTPTNSERQKISTSKKINWEINFWYHPGPPPFVSLPGVTWSRRMNCYRAGTTARNNRVALLLPPLLLGIAILPLGLCSRSIDCCGAATAAPPATTATRDPRMHFWIQDLCRVSGPITLGKDSAERNIRQRALGSDFVGKDVFAECLLSGTRQRLCRVSGTALGKRK
jgi:hypothetical protein